MEAQEARAPLPRWWDADREDFARPVTEVADVDALSRGRLLSFEDAVDIAVAGGGDT